MKVSSSDSSAVAELGNDRRDKWSWFIPALFKVMSPGLFPPVGPWVLPELKEPVYTCCEEHKRYGKRERGNEA